MNLTRIFVLLVFGYLAFSMIIPAFDDSKAERQRQLVEAINTNLDKGRKALDADVLPYDRLLTNYATDARDMVPEHGATIAKLATMGTSANPKFKEIEAERDLIVKGMAENKINPDIGLERLALLKAASHPGVIEEGLVDEINTISALTKGRLSPVGQSQDKLGQPGANLVGNPAYGQWQRQPDGSLLWVWLAQWAVLSTLFQGPSYANWYYNRPWSYDYDRYRSNLGSGTWRDRELNNMRTSWSNIQARGQETGRKPSTYANRQNNTMRKSTAYAQSGGLYKNFATTRAQAATTGPRKASVYSNPSNPSGFRSSSRSGSYSGSRRGGK